MEVLRRGVLLTAFGSCPKEGFGVGDIEPSGFPTMQLAT
jgi:hypothetical protein